MARQQRCHVVHPHRGVHVEEEGEGGLRRRPQRGPGVNHLGRCIVERVSRHKSTFGGSAEGQMKAKAAKASRSRVVIAFRTEKPRAEDELSSRTNNSRHVADGRCCRQR
eukprot:5309369-Prymnesium_polylepis.1